MTLSPERQSARMSKMSVLIIYSSKCSFNMFYSFRAYQLYFIYLQQSMTRGQKVSKAAHSFKFRTQLNFSIIQPLKSSLILQCTHVFPKNTSLGSFGKFLVSIDLCRKWGAIREYIGGRLYILQMAISPQAVFRSTSCLVLSGVFGDGGSNGAISANYMYG